MNISMLQIELRNTCNCGEKGLYFRLHEVTCPFFQTQLKLQEELERGERR